MLYPGGQIERPQSPDYIPNRARTRATAPQTTACPLQWGCHVGFNGTEDFALVRNRTTRQRRFIRPASFAGLSFLLERRGGMAEI